MFRLHPLKGDLARDEASHRVRADMVVRLGDQVFVPEFTMAEGEGGGAAALAQMRERGNAETYRDHGNAVHLVGVACGREARSLLDIRAESV